MIKPLLGDNHDDGVADDYEDDNDADDYDYGDDPDDGDDDENEDDDDDHDDGVIRREDALRPPRPDIIKPLQVVPALKMEQGSNWLAWAPLK